MERYTLLYNNNKPYKPGPSWVTATEFKPDPVINNKREFVPATFKQLGTGTGIRTPDQ
jgi:hypothetical protein